VRDLLYHAAWLIIIPLSFYSAHISILAWVWVALLPPANLLYGRLGAVLPFNKIVAATTVFVLIAGDTKKDFYRDPLIVAIVLYSVIVTLTYFTQPFDSGTSDLQYDKFWKEIVLFFLMTGLMFTRHRLHSVALVVALAFGFMMVKEGLIFLLTAGGHKIDAIGTVGDNNGLALALLMTLPLLLYCAKYTADYWIRIGMYITAGLGVVTVIATYSRGGFVGLIVLGLMLLKGSKYKVRAVIAVAIVGALVLATAPDDYLARINTIKEASDDDSFSTRVVAWKINYMMALDHPILGNGLYASLVWDNWARHVGDATTFLFPSPLVMRTFVAHSIYFQVLGDTGFTGFFLFLTMLGIAMIMTLRTQRLARRDPSLEWSGELARALQISLVIYCVAGAALSLVYFELLYILLAMVSRNYRTARQTAAARVAPVGTRVPSRLIPAYPKAA